MQHLVPGRSQHILIDLNKKGMLVLELACTTNTVRIELLLCYIRKKQMCHIIANQVYIDHVMRKSY